MLKDRKKELFYLSTERKQTKDLINEINRVSKCEDKFDTCNNGNLYTPPNSTGQIVDNTKTDCDNPLNPEAETRMWLNCCKTCSNKIKDTNGISKCVDFLGKDDSGNNICDTNVENYGCQGLLNIMCCKTCSIYNKPKFIIDKNLKINDSVVLYNNNFELGKDFDRPVKNVLNYANDNNYDTLRNDEDASLYIKTRDNVGLYFTQNEDKQPTILLNDVDINGDVLDDLLKFRSPYMKPFNPNPRVSVDNDTIYKYELYDSDKKYEKLCFDDRTVPNGQDICIDSDHLKIINGDRDFKIKSSNSKCLSLRDPSTSPEHGVYTNDKNQYFDKTAAGWWHHPEDSPEHAPANKIDNKGMLFFENCNNHHNNRFTFDKINEIDSKLNINETC